MELSNHINTLLWNGGEKLDWYTEYSNKFDDNKWKNKFTKYSRIYYPFFDNNIDQNELYLKYTIYNEIKLSFYNFMYEFYCYQRYYEFYLLENEIKVLNEEDFKKIDLKMKELNDFLEKTDIENKLYKNIKN